MSTPQNCSEVRSLLGMVNYCACFIPDFATITQPLCDLTKKDVQWSREPKHTEVLKMLTEKLVCNPVKSYFDQNKQTEVVVDASPVGLGAILAQKQNT